MDKIEWGKHKTWFSLDTAIDNDDKFKTLIYNPKNIFTYVSVVPIFKLAF